MTTYDATLRAALMSGNPNDFDHAPPPKFFLEMPANLVQPGQFDKAPTEIIDRAAGRPMVNDMEQSVSAAKNCPTSAVQAAAPEIIAMERPEIGSGKCILKAGPIFRHPWHNSRQRQK